MLRDQGRIPGHREIEPQVFSLRNVKLQASDPRSGEGLRAGGRRDACDFRNTVIRNGLNILHDRNELISARLQRR